MKLIRNKLKLCTCTENTTFLILNHYTKISYPPTSLNWIETLNNSNKIYCPTTYFSCSFLMEYLLKLTSAFWQDNNLLIEGLPSTCFKAEVKNVSDGLLGARHISSKPHLLLHIQQLLYFRLQITSFLKVSQIQINKVLLQFTPTVNESQHFKRK